MVDLDVDSLIKKLNEQCPGKGSQWHADEDGCGQYIFLWAPKILVIVNIILQKEGFPRPFFFGIFYL